VRRGPQGGSEANPKIDPAPNSNTEKEPDDWVSGDDPMTGAQASYLKTLSEECAIRTVSNRTSPRLKRQNASMHSSRSEDRCNIGNPR
jgi:Protein of unknown function (DUF3072)